MDPVTGLGENIHPALDTAGSTSAVVADGYDTM